GEPPELVLGFLGDVVAAVGAGGPEAAGRIPPRHAAQIAEGVLRAIVGLGKPWVRSDVAPDQLHRDRTIVDLVVGLVDGPEAALAQEPAHVVAAGDALGHRARRVVLAHDLSGIFVAI